MKIARINAATGEVLNVEVWAETPEDTADHLFREVTDGAGIGCTWDGTAFVLPDPGPAPRRLIPKSLVQERVNALGKWDDVVALMFGPTGKPNIYFGRWFASDYPNVYFDDPDMLTILGAVGCTQGQIATITAA